MSRIRRSRCPVCGQRYLAVSDHNLPGRPCHIAGHAPVPRCRGLLERDGVYDTANPGDQTLDTFVHDDEPLGVDLSPVPYILDYPPPPYEWRCHG